MPEGYGRPLVASFILVGENDDCVVYGDNSAEPPEITWTHPETGVVYQETVELKLPHRIHYLLGDEIKVTLERYDEEARRVEAEESERRVAEADEVFNRAGGF